MSTIRKCSIGVAATLVLAASGASAQSTSSRKMLVLIDASGSMGTPRPADPVNPDRFAAAKRRAESQIVDQSRLGQLDGVAVYTFSDLSATLQTEGFVDPNLARARIAELSLFDVGGGTTPLAGSLCEAVDVLVDEAPGIDDVRILALSSDGEENTTPLGNPCQGPPSTLPDPPYSGGSWQNKVLNYVVDNGVSPYIDLFDPGPIIGARRGSGADQRASAALRADQVGLAPPALADFFAELARAGGGRLTVIEDDQAALPVFADFTGNACTDRSDAILVARAFGRTGAPQDNPFDLDADGVVGFADYAHSLVAFTAGGCGAPDPYVARAPLVCTSAAPITINGAVIEGSGITIDARSICRITIRNSLIVSGESAIKVSGSAILTIDDSILVGEGAVLSSDGSVALSAARSVFHGPRVTEGAFVFLDRGGNVFE